MEFSVEIIEKLINDGCNLNIYGEYGSTPLHWAIYNNKEKLVELLINAGCDVNLQSNFGFTPLHLAAKYEYTKIVELLIQANADVFNIKNKENKTPYDYFNEELKKHCLIVEVTQSIGIIKGRFTKCARVNNSG